MASLSNLLADLLRVRAIHLARFDAGMQKRIIAHLKTLERQIVSKISELEYFGELTPSARASLEATLTWSRATIDNTYQRIDRQATTELRDLAAAEAKWIEQSFDGALGIKLIDTAMSPTGLAAIVDGTMVRGNPSEEWWAGQSMALQRKFSSQMRLGLTAGESISDLIVRIRGNDNTAGIMDASRREVAALVRTSVQSVANETRMQIYKQNDDVVGALQHVSTLDDRTTDICKARDGLQWKLDGEPIGHSIPFERPPLHWNCRSTVVPVTKTWKQMGFNINELTPQQRASMDGAVPADMTYEEWLKTKSVEFQDRVLGQGKAELWRDGSISLRDLLDQSGRPLTLEQLEALATERDLADVEPPSEGMVMAEEPPAPPPPPAPVPPAPLAPAVPAASGDVLNGPDWFKDADGTFMYIGDPPDHEEWPTYVDETKSRAVMAYTSDAYRYMQIQRREIAAGRMKLEDVPMIKAFDDKIWSHGAEQTVYRGTWETGTSAFADLKVGSILKTDGYTSTSTDAGVALNFATNASNSGTATLFEFKLSPKTMTLVTNADEMEVVLDHGQKFKVVGVREGNFKFEIRKRGKVQENVNKIITLEPVK